MRKTYKILFFLLILFFPLNIKAADRVHFTNIYEFGTPGGSGSSSGEATLVESNGHYGLVDTGNPHNSSDPYYQTQLNGKTIAAYLKANGCNHLDFVLVTHAHSDHVGGIPYLYSAGYINNKTTFIYKEFQSDNTTEGSSWNTKKYFNNAKSTMQSAGAKMLEVSSKTGLSSLNAKYTNNGGKATDYIEFSFQNFNIKIFNLYYAAKNESENHNSLVVLISKDSQKILLKSELGIPVSGSDTSREQNIASYIGKVQLARVGHYTSQYLSLHFLDKTNPDILVLLANNAKSGETYTQNNDITIGYAFMNSKSSGKTIGIIDQANPMVFQVNSSSIAMYNNKNGSLTTLTKTLNSKVKNGWYSIKDKSPTAENWIYIKDSKILKGVQKLPISDNSSRNAYFYLQSKSTASVSAGVMRTGWQTVNNETYYLNPSTSGNKVKGEALTGWQQIQRSGTNYWYYFDGTGKMKTGWQQINGTWYYLAEEADMFTDFKYKGAMVKGLKTVPYENKNYKYYFDDSGAMKTGWIKVGNYWYYFATSASEFSGFNTGSAVTGIKTINGKTYCFNNESKMATNTNVNHYSCNADGIATIWKIKVTTKWLEQSTNKVLATAETKTYNYGQSYTTTKKTINGYDYISSTNNKSGAAKGNSNGETITVTYYYKKYGTYSIAYNLNGGTVSGNPTIYERTTASFTLKNPTKTGYTFAGWTGTGLSAKTKTVKIASGSSGNRTYTANWTPNKIYIRFNMNGGSLSSTHGAEYSTSGSYVTRNGSLNVQTLSYGASLSSNGLANYNNKNYLNIVRTGYTAVSKAEWKTKDGSKTYDQSAVYKASDFCNAGSGNCTVDLYVNWKATAYKITYALNNGTVSGNPATYYITSNDITLNKPTRAGYTFAGWTGTGLSTITKIVTIAKGSTGNKSYTANWTPNTYTISYELNGGSDPGNPTKYKVDSADITLNKPTRAGYTFAGWIGSNGTTLQSTVTIPKGSTGNKNYIANWVAIDYKITYDLNGGTVSGNPNSYNILCDDIILNNPTKDGYTFVGWTGSNGETAQTTVTIPKGSTGIKTYTANWTPNKIYIKMHMNGGYLDNEHGTEIDTSNEYITVNGSENIHILNYGTSLTPNGLADYNNDSYINIKKKGYEAVKGEEWKNSDGSKTYSQTTQYQASDLCDAKNGDCTAVLYVNWTPINYTITYKLNNGTPGENPDSYNITSDDITLNNPTREGYNFTGWTGSNGETPEKIVTITKGSTGNKTYKANWEANKYTITFESNGGSHVSPIEAKYNEEITKPENPEKTDYTFAGWYSDEELTKLYTFNKMPAENITLYAKWTNENVIEYEMHGGINNEENPTTYASGEEKILKDPTKNGSTFDGWYLDNEYTQKIEKISSSMNGNITLHAKWKKTTYTISFNSNGGSLVNPIEAKYNEEITKPENPEKEGYEFINWYTDENLTNEYEFNKMPAQNITLYAKWEINTYEIIFNTNGGTALSKIKVKRGEKIVRPSNPYKKGHTFKDWYNEESLNTTYNFESPVYESKTLYAAYEVNKYNVIYNTNGGNGISSVSVTFNETVPRPNDPVKEGHTFIGWLKNATENYTFGLMPDEDLYLYANWEKNKYTISFNSNGGSAVNPITENYGDAINEPDVPIKDNYKFAGWYTDEELTKLYSFTTMPAENMTLYAKWTGNENIIRYQTNGGEIDESSITTYTYGQEVILPEAQREHYQFDGWYTDENYTEKTETITPNTNEDVNLYAKWTVNKYTISFNTNGGQQIDQIEVEYDEEIPTLAAAEKEDNAFVRWHTNEELTQPFIYENMPGENITLYAEYTPANYHQITFNSNGGDLVNPIIEESGQDIQKPNNPYKEGYKFAGWYTDENFTELYSFTTMPDENITLYAKWVSNDYYVIRYETNGGTNDINNPTAYEEGKSVQINNPTREGYIFVGWYTDENFTEAFTNTNNKTGDITLYAKWTKDYLVVNVPKTSAQISLVMTALGVLTITRSVTIIYNLTNQKKSS